MEARRINCILHEVESAARCPCINGSLSLKITTTYNRMQVEEKEPDELGKMTGTETDEVFD